MKLLDFATRMAAAIILGQTLYFKFTAAPESVWIFSQLGVEPWGRLLAGFSEFVVCVLLFLPRTIVIGALSGMLIMSAALMTHAVKLGITVRNDHGLLFCMACAVFLCCAYSFWFHKKELGKFIKRSSASRPQD